MVCASITCMRIFMVFAYPWKPLQRQEDVTLWEGSICFLRQNEMLILVKMHFILLRRFIYSFSFPLTVFHTLWTWGNVSQFQELSCFANPTQNILIKIDLVVGCRIVYLHLVALDLSVDQGFTVCYKQADRIALIWSSNQWDLFCWGLDEERHL